MDENAPVTEAEFRDRFEAARLACLTGHEADCTYGGLSPGGGYWLAVEGCPLGHGEHCAICGSKSEARFGDWTVEDGVLMIWGVFLCVGCRDRQLALDPHTWRSPGLSGLAPEPAQPTGEPLPEHQFDGFLSVLDAVKGQQ